VRGQPARRRLSSTFGDVRCAVYLRQSQDRAGDQLGIDRQRTDVLAMVAARGWIVVNTFVDNDVSASSRKPRPAFQEMLALIESGRVDVIAARHMDRLLRRLAELEDLLARCERHQVSIVTAADGVDTRTDGGRLVARILSSVAQGEVERKASRQLSSNLQAAQAGRWSGGRRAFGFEADGVTVREHEARAIRAGYEAVLAGASLSSVAAEWNALGFSTTQGHRDGTSRSWSYNGVFTVLTNPRHAGLRRHATADLVAGRYQNPSAGVVGAAEWPALVPEETWRATVDLLTNPARRTGSPGAKRLLTGVGRCGVCGATVHGCNTRRDQPGYVCSSGRYCVTRKGDVVDGYVEAVTKARLARPDAIELLATAVGGRDMAELRTEALALRGRLDTIAVDFADGTLSSHQLRAVNSRISERLAAVETEMASAGRGDLFGSLIGSRDIDATWASMEVHQRRATIDSLMIPYLLSPGRGSRTFREASIRIEWKRD
jgi:site-specific DNA recombinase